MKSSRFPPIAGALAIGLAGCAGEPPAPVVDLSLPSTAARPAATAETSPGIYRVVRGDTLYAIAFKHGLDYRDLAAWNGIAAPYRILVGQQLRLSAPQRVEPTQTAPIAASSAAPAAVPTAPAPGAAVTSPVPERPAAAGDTASSKSSPPVTAGFQPVEEARPAPAEVETPPPAAPPHAVAPPAPPKGTSIATASPGAPPVTEPAAAARSAPTAPRTGEAVPELNAGGVTWRWPSDGKVIAAYVAGDPIRQGIDVGGQAGDPVRAAADGDVVYSGNGLIGYGELIIVKHNANFLSAYGHNRKRLVAEGAHVKAGQTIAEMGSSASSRDELHFEIRKNGKPVNPLEYLPAR